MDLSYTVSWCPSTHFRLYNRSIRTSTSCAPIANKCIKLKHPQHKTRSYNMVTIFTGPKPRVIIKLETKRFLSS
uniref:Uncharacterized protein n=1 Tax=Rhizophora mucronata TaxID=61149 RepID=A0A2P2LZW1_RHIMU